MASLTISIGSVFCTVTSVFFTVASVFFTEASVLISKASFFCSVALEETSVFFSIVSIFSTEASLFSTVATFLLTVDSTFFKISSLFFLQAAFLFFEAFCFSVMAGSVKRDSLVELDLKERDLLLTIVFGDSSKLGLNSSFLSSFASIVSSLAMFIWGEVLTSSFVMAPILIAKAFLFLVSASMLAFVTTDPMFMLEILILSSWFIFFWVFVTPISLESLSFFVLESSFLALVSSTFSLIDALLSGSSVSALFESVGFCSFPIKAPSTTPSVVLISSSEALSSFFMAMFSFVGTDFGWLSFVEDSPVLPRVVFSSEVSLMFSAFTSSIEVLVLSAASASSLWNNSLWWASEISLCSSMISVFSDRSFISSFFTFPSCLVVSSTSSEMVFELPSSSGASWICSFESNARFPSSPLVSSWFKVFWSLTKTSSSTLILRLEGSLSSFSGLILSTICWIMFRFSGVLILDSLQIESSSLVTSSLSLLSVELFLSPSLLLDFFFLAFITSTPLGDFGGLTTSFFGEYFLIIPKMRDWRSCSSSVTLLMMALRVLVTSRGTLADRGGSWFTELSLVEGRLVVLLAGEGGLVDGSASAGFFSGFLLDFLAMMAVSHWAWRSDLSVSTKS